jgi:hemin uptake protein HemP
MTENLPDTDPGTPDTGDVYRRLPGTLSLAARRDDGAITRLAPPLSRRQVKAELRDERSESSVDTVPLRRLTAGRKALKIAHAGKTYLLQITKANKLILTKPALSDKEAASVKG